ncbi:MAG: DUF4389 domain-containing protein [Kordiimonadaceae bacterium]|nr:DUF4389 domain-containing protein [Kordiimonadaceae bacterium]
MKKVVEKKAVVKKVTAEKPTAKKVAPKPAIKPAIKKATVKAAAESTSATTAKTTAAKTQTASQPSPAAKKASGPTTSAKASAQQEADYATDAIVKEMKDKDWGASIKRGIFMVLFGIISQFVLSVTLFLAFVQFIVSLLLGPPNTALTSAIVMASKYLGEILAFESFRTDDLPFPFGNDFPEDK